MLESREIRFIENNTIFYKKLTKEQKESFIKNSFYSSIEKGSFPYSSHRECSGLIIVLSGALRIFISSNEGREISLYRLLRGDTCIFTASCIFNNISFNINIESLEDTEVIIVPSNIVESISNENIDFQKYILNLTQAKMSEVMQVMEQSFFVSLDRRLINYLESFNLVNIKVTHNEIAKELGSAREVISRLLKDFEKKGMVKLKRGEIEIVDLGSSR